MEINKIHLGDAYELIKQVPDKSVDLIVTDPPYEIKGLSEKPHGLSKWKPGSIKHEKEMFEMKENLVEGVDLAILDEFVRVMKKINIYLWCNKEQIYDYLTYFVKERGCNWEMLIWAKENPAPFYGNHYLKDKEYCLYFWERGVDLDTRTFQTSKTVFLTQVNKADKGKYAHPTIKPEEIIENLIKNSCGGGLVFDPFVGSGTTCAVAKRLGYDYLGFEINPKWHAVAVDRLNGITKKQRDAGIEQLRLF